MSGTKLRVSILLAGLCVIAIVWYLLGSLDISPGIINGDPAAVAMEKHSVASLTKKADNIIIGQVDNSEDFGNGSLTYFVEVNRDIKGKIDNKTLEVFSLTPLEVNNTYFLFLESNEHEYTQHTQYTVLNHSFLNPIANGKITKGPFRDKQTKFLEDEVKSAPGIAHFREQRKVLDKADSLEALVKLSDYVVRLKPTEIIEENQNIRLCVVTFLETYKGDERILNRRNVILPKSVELNQEYLLFFQTDDDSQTENPTLLLTTRNGSIVAKGDTKHWEDAILYLNNL